MQLDFDPDQVVTGELARAGVAKQICRRSTVPVGDGEPGEDAVKPDDAQNKCQQHDMQPRRRGKPSDKKRDPGRHPRAADAGR